MLDTKEKWIRSVKAITRVPIARILSGLMTGLSQRYHISDPTDEWGIHLGPSHIPFQREGMVKALWSITIWSPSLLDTPVLGSLGSLITHSLHTIPQHTSPDTKGTINITPFDWQCSFQISWSIFTSLSTILVQLTPLTKGKTEVRQRVRRSPILTAHRKGGRTFWL